MKIRNEEYAQRMDMLQKAVAENGLDMFLVSAQESIYYLTGVTYKPLERPFFLMVGKSGQAVILAPLMEKEHLSEAPNVREVYAYREFPAPPGEGWQDKLLSLLDGVKVLGIEPSLPSDLAEKLGEFRPKCLPLVENIRLVKSDAEIGLLRKSAEFADKAISRVIEAAYYGVSELELFSQGRSIQMEIIKSEGKDYDVLNTEILAGAWPAPLSAQPHGVPGLGDRLGDGPHIAMTLMRVNGYSTECERTFFLSRPTKEVIHAFETMREARRLAFSMIRPGVGCSSIDAAVNEFLHSKGYEKNLLHRTGHGFGLSTHEGPWIAEGSGDILEKNMLISIEPGIYLEGIGGIRHSDTVLVTEDGYETLTKYPDDLESLIIKPRKTLKKLKGKVIRKFLKIDRI